MLGRWPALVCSATLVACLLSACGPALATLHAPTEPTSAAALGAYPAHTPATVVHLPASGFVTVADQQAAPRSNRGRVTAIEPISQRPKSGNTGGVVGGVIGAVIGNQIGSGTGRAAATVAGGVGGALVGNKIERSRSETVVGYRVHVQQDDGRERVFERSQRNGLNVGDRVHINGSSLRKL